MKTSLDIPDALYREVKVKAAQEGRKVSDVVVEGLRMVVGGRKGKVRRLEFPLLPAKAGRPTITSAGVKRALQRMDEEEDARVGASIRR